MARVYQIFLVVFVIFIGINVYALDWEIGILHQYNTKFVFSIVAGIIGVMLVYVLSTWSKISSKRG